MSELTIARTLHADDLETDVDRREVVAYASVFDTPTEIVDRHGHYYESIGRTAFDVTLRDGLSRIRSLVNHGQDLYGNPSDRFALPYGTVVEARADGRGLLTVTKVAATPLGDEVLELLRAGAFDGFSFSGRVLNTNVIDPIRHDDLPTLVRTEIALREFGPAVFPAYADAQLVATRTDSTVPSGPVAAPSAPDVPPADGSDTSRAAGQAPDSPPQAASANAAHQVLRRIHTRS